MDQRLSVVTLIVGDVAASRRFYVDGLRWEPAADVPGEVLMFRVADRLLLSLWDRASAAGELGPIDLSAGPPPITLAHNVRSAAEVDAVLAIAEAAGATAVSTAEHRAWGGYSGYFADPDGFRWEIAWNPGEIGNLVLP